MYFTIKDIQKRIGFKGRIVLVRHGFDVLDKKTGKIKDDKRIIDGSETIKYLSDKGAKVVLLGHNGRPGGKKAAKLSHKNIQRKLSKVLGKKVITAPDCIGKKTEEMIYKMQDGDILSLENVRFHPEEKSKKKSERRKFAKILASMAEIYVDDAFNNVHRDHASMTEIPNYLPSCAGFLLQRELERLSALDKPERPYVAIIGGAKLDKISLIKKMLKKADTVILGGGLVFTFYKLMGFEIGRSLYDEENEKQAKKLLRKNKIYLPRDVTIANRIGSNAKTKNALLGHIPSTWIGVDIGEETVKDILYILRNAKTVSWNGPLGIFEIKKFREQSRKVAEYLGRKKSTRTIVGGGDTAKFFEVIGLDKEVYHVSTGGGASLQYIEGYKLPAVRALEKSYKKFQRRDINGRSIRIDDSKIRKRKRNL